MKPISLVAVLGVVLCCFSVAQAYSVSGNKILDPNGNVILLRGVDRPSMEWSATGEMLSSNDYALMKAWGANCVRVSLNQDTFLASSDYRTLVAQQATWIKALGMGVIFDLHWNNGGQQTFADANSVTFWSQMATTFLNDPWVIFELYNEPHDISWAAWQSGSPGMQQLYNAVRATGANNVVIVCGLNWAYDLSGVSNGYAISGTNIVYGTHPYDYSGKQSDSWDVSFGNLAATYPVMMTEFGQYCLSDTYVSALLQYAQAKGIHWSAWAWYVNSCSFPSIIADWNGTPTSPVGTIVKAYLGGNGTVSTPSTTGSISQASQALVVYSDSLQNNFQDWSWDASYSLADSTYHHSGSYSIRFALENYQAVYFHLSSASYDFYLGTYTSVQFYVFSTTSFPSSELAVLIYDTTATLIGNSIGFASTANTWTLITVPVSSFGVSLSTLISGIAFQGIVSSTTSIGNVWLDDISFVPSASSTTTGGSTTGAATTAPTSAPTPTPTPKATAAPTSAPTPTPTPKATSAPTTAPTPTPKATSAPTTAPTTAPTPTPKATSAPTTAPTPTPKATSAPTTAPTPTPTPKATSAPTAAPTPTPKATSAPTTAPTSAPTTSPSACDATAIHIVQTLTNSWVSGTQTISQFTVTISSTCATKTLTALTFNLPSTWSPIGYWGATASGSNLVFPSYMTVTPTTPYTSFGYQNVGQVAFTVASYTFS